MVTAERRIIDVLLAIPRGPERSDTLTDALTPPPQVGLYGAGCRVQGAGCRVLAPEM